MSKQKIKVQIEICSNCKSHQWCTRHNQKYYSSLAQQIQKGIKSHDDSIQVDIFQVGGQKMGSFQITCNGTLLFSKLNLGYFPHVPSALSRIFSFIDDYKKGSDLKKYTEAKVVSPHKTINNNSSQVVNSPNRQTRSPARRIKYNPDYKEQNKEHNNSEIINNKHQQHNKQAKHEETKQHKKQQKKHQQHKNEKKNEHTKEQKHEEKPKESHKNNEAAQHKNQHKKTQKHQEVKKENHKHEEPAHKQHKIDNHKQQPANHKEQKNHEPKKDDKSHDVKTDDKKKQQGQKKEEVHKTEEKKKDQQKKQDQTHKKQEKNINEHKNQQGFILNQNKVDQHKNVKSQNKQQAPIILQKTSEQPKAKAQTTQNNVKQTQKDPVGNDSKISNKQQNYQEDFEKDPSAIKKQ